MPGFFAFCGAFAGRDSRRGGEGEARRGSWDFLLWEERVRGGGEGECREWVVFFCGRGENPRRWRGGVPGSERPRRRGGGEYSRRDGGERPLTDAGGGGGGEKSLSGER